METSYLNAVSPSNSLSFPFSQNHFLIPTHDILNPNNKEQKTQFITFISNSFRPTVDYYDLLCRVQSLRCDSFLKIIADISRRNAGDPLIKSPRPSPSLLINRVFNAAFRPRPSAPLVTNLEVLWPTSPCVPSAFRPGGWGWTAGGRSCQAACCRSPSTPLRARSAPARCRWRAAGRAPPPWARGAPGRWRRWRSAPSPRTDSRPRLRRRTFGRPLSPAGPRWLPSASLASWTSALWRLKKKPKQKKTVFTIKSMITWTCNKHFNVETIFHLPNFLVSRCRKGTDTSSTMEPRGFDRAGIKQLHQSEEICYTSFVGSCKVCLFGVKTPSQAFSEK